MSCSLGRAPHPVPSPARRRPVAQGASASPLHPQKTKKDSHSPPPTTAQRTRLHAPSPACPPGEGAWRRALLPLGLPKSGLPARPRPAEAPGGSSAPPAAQQIPPRPSQAGQYNSKSYFTVAKERHMSRGGCGALPRAPGVQGGSWPAPLLAPWQPGGRARRTALRYFSQFPKKPRPKKPCRVSSGLPSPGGIALRTGKPVPLPLHQPSSHLRVPPGTGGPSRPLPDSTPSPHTPEAS